MSKTVYNFDREEREPQRLAETFSDLPPEQHARAVANGGAATQKAKEPTPEIDWDRAIAHLRQMLEDLEE